MKRRFIACWLVLTSVLTSSARAHSEEQKPDPWEATIRHFEAEDAKTPPPKQAILFVGSSSVVMWNLKESFPDWVTINRGFGGSQIADSVRFVERIVTPYDPQAIVFYAGDNDIAAGKSPETVAKDFSTFVEAVRAKLPKVPLYYIGIKPSIARWHLIKEIRDTNRRIAAICGAGDRLTFIDVEPSMLGEDGKPKAVFLRDDGLHMTPQGYAAWNELVRLAIRKR